MTKRDFVALAFSLSLLVTAVPNSSCSFSSSSSSNSICKSDEERGIEEKGSCEDDDDDDPAEATLGPIVDSGLMDETLNGLDQRDHRLVKEVGRFLESPSEKPYNFNKGKEGLALKGEFVRSGLFSGPLYSLYQTLHLRAVRSNARRGAALLRAVAGEGLLPGGGRLRRRVHLKHTPVRS